MRRDRKPDKKEFTSVLNAKDIHEILRKINGEGEYDRYRAEWEKTSFLEYVPAYPLQLDFELNYSCNFSCNMCTWSAESSAHKGKETWLDFEVFKEIVDDGVRKGLKAIRLNYINEPLIRRDIIEFIAYAKKAGVLDTYFSTNGSLLTEDVSAALIDSGLDRLQVSLDALTQETFDKIRVGGNLERIIQNIVAFIGIREKKGRLTPLMRVNFVKTRDNIQELDDFISYWRSRADGIGVQNYVDILNKAEMAKGSDTKVEFHCAHPFYHMTIRYDGTILPCCSLFGAEAPIARIKTSWPERLSTVENHAVDAHKMAELMIQSIDEAWNGEQMKFFRKMHKQGEYWKHPVCNKCVLGSSHADETLEF